MGPGSYWLQSLGVQGAAPLGGEAAWVQGPTWLHSAMALWRGWEEGDSGHQEPGRPLQLKELRTGQGRLHWGTALVRGGLEGPNFHGLAGSLWVQGSHSAWIWGQAVGSHLLPHGQGTFHT